MPVDTIELRGGNEIKMMKAVSGGQQSSVTRAGGMWRVEEEEGVTTRTKGIKKRKIR